MGGISLQPGTFCSGAALQSRSVRLLLDLALWRIISSLGAPFGRILAVFLFLGRSFSTIVSELQRSILSVVGWLSAPPSLPLLRHLGQSFLHTRRWHFGAGTIQKPLYVHQDVILKEPSSKTSARFKNAELRQVTESSTTSCSASAFRYCMVL